MRRGIPAVILLLALSLTATARAAPAEDSKLDNLSEDRADTAFVNAPDNVSSNATDEATSISARGTYDYTGTVENSGKVTTNYGYPTSGQCGLRVNFPHASNDYSEEIHTRIESFCKVLPLVSNTISGKTYRSRWYGWQHVSDLPAETKYAPSSSVQNYRRTAVAKCKAGDWYRYRTEGFGTVSTGVQSFSAAAYEQNDKEIQCVLR